MGEASGLGLWIEWKEWKNTSFFSLEGKETKVQDLDEILLKTIDFKPKNQQTRKALAFLKQCWFLRQNL
jgi:hypothetical protein